MNYDTFRTELVRLYMNQEYAAALDLIQRESEAFSEHAVRTLYWRACVEGLSGHLEDALASLETLAARGDWYDPELVRGDPDLAGLRDRPEFATVLRRFAERAEQARREARPELRVLEPPSGAPRPYPLLTAIHGRSDNAALFAPRWQALADQGWLVALPQSSIILASESYGWDDHSRAIAEIRAHYADLCRRYTIDPARVVVAGFSQGGGLSVFLTVTQQIPATAFIGLAPYLHGIETMEIPIAPAAAQARGLLVTGDQDNGQEMFAHFEALLDQASVTYQRRRYAELAHELPGDFDTLLDTTLHGWFDTP